MGARLLVIALALVGATAAFSQTLPLTLTNLKAPIARICGQKPAASIAALWKQIAACGPVAAPSPSPTSTPVTAPITDTMRASLIGPGYDRGGGNRIPGSAAPDVLGAFRMICSSGGPLNYDDAILYPGIFGGSPHLHENVGNKTINAASTHETLLAAGDSTCSNALNRSAYWWPALLRGDGKSVIRADFAALYYKRLPSGPSCFALAAKGCVGIPDGLRYLSGFDMKRMGEVQPENATYSFRCIEEGRPQEHRKLIGEAVKDCGGAGRVWAQVDFGNCWNGQLDSPDHRKHVAFGGYGDWGYYRCPTSHPYAIPQLAQIIQFTIEKSDGDIAFSSDRMAGMNMPGGSTFHADYIEAWDKKTKTTWEINCLDKLLSCSDGELGDGTMLRRAVQTYKAEPRLVPVPARPAA